MYSFPDADIYYYTDPRPLFFTLLLIRWFKENRFLQTKHQKLAQNIAGSPSSGVSVVSVLLFQYGGIL